MSTYEDDLRRYKRLYEEEYQIVAKCWEALGISTYEGANGRSIYELIAECRAKADRSGEADQRCQHVTCEDVNRILLMERDAVRYRWIRERGAWETEAFLAGISPEEYDAAIDAAMPAQSDTEERK